MKANLFSPILILLILTLFTKASLLFGRIQEQTTYATNTSTSSVLVDTAYAKTQHSSQTSGQHSKKHEQPEENLGAKIVTTSDPVSTVTRANSGKDPVINNLSRSEMDLLKELAKRRDTIEKDKKDLNIREQVLKATEDKIDQKVVELQNLQTQLESLMKQYDQKEHGKILSLVKIYETMKPKDAAKIFNELEMPVLLKVVSNMKEVKVAPIIASMDPAKARDLSIELAKQKPIE